MSYITKTITNFWDVDEGDALVIQVGIRGSELQAGRAVLGANGKLSVNGFSLEDPQVLIVSITRLVETVDLPTKPGVYSITQLVGPGSATDTGIYLCTLTGETPRYYFMYQTGVVETRASTLKNAIIVRDLFVYEKDS